MNAYERANTTMAEGGKTRKSVITRTKRKSEKLLSLRGSTPTRVEVTYDKIASSGVVDGKPVSMQDPHSGKTYVVEAIGDKVRVTTRDGRTVPQDEQTAVVEDYKTLGKPEPVLESLPTTPIRIGARVPSIEASLKTSTLRYMGVPPEMKVRFEPIVVKLTRTGRVDGYEAAQLDYTMTMVMEHSSGITMKWRMSGTYVVRVSNGWPLRTNVNGVVETAGNRYSSVVSVSQRFQYR